MNLLAKMDDLTPRKIVEEADKYIIGQKMQKAVAIGSDESIKKKVNTRSMKDEVAPKYNYDRANRYRQDRR